MADPSGLPPLPPLEDHRSPTLSTITSVQSKVGDSGGGGDDDVVSVPAGDDAEVDAVASLVPLKKVWNCDMIEQGTNGDGEIIWTCKHCGKSFAGSNATKAIHHVLKKKGQNIALCTAMIPSIYLRRYEDFYEKNALSRQSKKVQTVSDLFSCFLLTSIFRSIHVRVSVDREGGLSKMLSVRPVLSTTSIVDKTNGRRFNRPCLRA